MPAPPGPRANAEFLSMEATLLDLLQDNTYQTIRATHNIYTLRKMQTDLQFTINLINCSINAFAPVNRLPQEILGRIFSELNQDTKTDFIPDMHMRPLYSGWLPVSHVCRYWREAAELCADLWSDIDDKVPDIASEAIKRGGVNPLRVFLRPSRGHGSHYIPEFLDSLALQSYRFKEFHFELPLNSTNLLRAFCRTPAPNLESLTLTAYEAVEEICRIHPVRYDPALPALFGGHLPRLKNLTLAYFTSWPKNMFTGLTRLCLRSYDHHTITVQRFRDLLLANQSLEELILYAAGPGSESIYEYMQNPQPPIVLPRLRKCSIGALVPGEVADYLSLLLLPVGVTLRIFNIEDDIPVKDYTEFLSVLPDFACTWTHIHDTHAVRIEELPAFDKVRLTAVGRGSALDIERNIHDGKDALSAERSLRHLTCVLPLWNIRELWLTTSSDKDPRSSTGTTWREFLGSMPALGTLAICRRTTTPILLALLVAEMGNHRVVCCPQLFQLIISPRQGCDRTIMSELLTLGHNRLIHGHSIHTLSLEVGQVKPGSSNTHQADLPSLECLYQRVEIRTRGVDRPLVMEVPESLEVDLESRMHYE